MFSNLLHWGPLLALAIIKCIAFSTLQVASLCFLPYSTIPGILAYCSFILSVILTLYNFFCAAVIGPGYLPIQWTPENLEDCRFMQQCFTCEGYKAPRAHHCQKCKRCVMKMDHHCPWINNCVGHFNHGYFVFFLVFAVLGSFQASIYLSVGIYRALHFRQYIFYLNTRTLLDFNVYHLIFTVFSLGLAIGVVLALSGLFYIQMKSIIRNETNIENWIIMKAHGRPRPKDDVFVYPYHFGKWQNVKSVLFSKLGNGIHWETVDGLGKYTLTIEQLLQKKDKRARSLRYQIINPYNGAIFPISKGIRTCCSPPCTDESRMPVKVGNTILVSRWKKRWCYGEKQEMEIGQMDRSKGWFPRSCAVEFTSEDCNVDKITKKAQ